MSEPTKYVVPTDMLTGEWPGMRVYGDTTRVVTLADALAWVAQVRAEGDRRVAKLEAALARCGASRERALAENSELWKRLDATHEAHAAALAAVPDFSPQRDDESDREYLSRSIGRCAVTFDPKRGQNATAEAPDESRGHRVFTGEQSVTFDGKPNDPYRPASSVEADAIEAQAAEFLKPLLDVIVPSRHARTCGIWRITAAVARCTCQPASIEEAVSCPDCGRNLADSSVTCQEGRFAGWTCNAVSDAYRGRGA